jgi:hypothetical protein
MKKEKRVFAVNYLAYVNEETISNLYLMFRATPWSYTHYNPYNLKEEIETTDKRLGIE